MAYGPNFAQSTTKSIHTSLCIIVQKAFVVTITLQIYTITIHMQIYFLILYLLIYTKREIRRKKEREMIWESSIKVIKK